MSEGGTGGGKISKPTFQKEEEGENTLNNDFQRSSKVQKGRRRKIEEREIRCGC